MIFSDNKPIYMQIAELFFTTILQKKWVENEKIPSIRETAVELEVNPNTAMRTYSYLQDLGIIYNKRGIGYFLADGGYNKTLTFVKQKFINDELPLFFEKLKLLNITIDDIKKIANNTDDAGYS
jgi:DNA-binding transcriptional regulator YhcF (GntR family)